MGSESISEERRESFTIVRLNRPEKFNALSREMILALNAVFTNIESQPELRAIILTGAGDKAFCAGIEITESTEPATTEAGEVYELLQALCNQIENCPVPVIAAVNGLAAGGGCELALACHIRIGEPKASFSLRETEPGIVTAKVGTLAREIASGRDLEMKLTEKTIFADEALRIGFVNRLAAGGGAVTEAISLAAEISSLAPLAVRACIEAVTRGIELPLDEGLALEAQLFSSLFTTNDMREGTRAFLEKRRPVFTGT